MAARVHRLLNVMEFNTNDIWRQRYEFSKQLQDLHIDAALLSETYLKPHERFYIPNYHFYWNYRLPWRNGGTAVSVRKVIPHNHLLSASAYFNRSHRGLHTDWQYWSATSSRLYVPRPRLEYRHRWAFRHNWLLAEDLNGKHLFRNNVFSIPPGTTLLNLLHVNEFEISASQCSTNYSPAGNDDVLNIVVHKNVWLCSKEHDFSETGSPHAKEWKAPTLLYSLETANLIHITPVRKIISSEDRNRSSFRNILLFRIPDDGESPKTQ
jgi:hypothetical protein